MNIQFQNPFSQKGNWYKGNLHAHTTMSDGKKSPGDIVAMYQDGGYDFLAVTDHNKRTVVDSHTGKMLLIPGEEIDISYNGCYHLVAVNTREALSLPPEARRNVHPKDIIAAVKAKGGDVILAHPYWSNETLEMTRLCEGVLGVEVYNHVCHVDAANGHSMAHWDDMLRIGMRMFGFASDDSHHYVVRDMHPLDTQGGWIMVKTEQCTADAIMAAIRAGNFYASSGPDFKSVVIDGTTVTVETSPVRSIAFRTPQWGGARFEGNDGKLITRAVFTVKSADLRCLRVECTDEQGRMAWVNPLWIVA
ncbi:MAG: CehA/McbA family metallohydrolase [Spirochaetes bacterium]|nr:CehA/McbA family metallohydrolase [Spirochaetota bacterium]